MLLKSSVLVQATNRCQATAMDVSKRRMSGTAPHTPEKRKLSVSGTPTAGAAAFQAWLEEEEEEWIIGQKLAATCPAEFICPISLDIMTEPVILVGPAALSCHATVVDDACQSVICYYMDVTLTEGDASFAYQTVKQKIACRPRPG